MAGRPRQFFVVVVVVVVVVGGGDVVEVIVLGSREHESFQLYKSSGIIC